MTIIFYIVFEKLPYNSPSPISITDSVYETLKIRLIVRRRSDGPPLMANRFMRLFRPSK